MAVRNPRLILTTLIPRHWSERMIILLVMQSLNNSITVLRKQDRPAHVHAGRGRAEPDVDPGGQPGGPPARREHRRRARRHVGRPDEHPDDGALHRRLPDRRLRRQTGVIDPYHRLYGYDGLHVVDGSTLTANLGVNPALSITAQAERAMSLWPNHGTADLRPPLGAPYRRVAPVFPVKPIVPATRRPRCRSMRRRGRGTVGLIGLDPEQASAP